MKHSKPIISVVTGGNSKGKTRTERQVGTLRPVLDVVGDDTGEYRVVGRSGYIEATIRQGASLDWRVTTGDPYDMDSPSRTLPDGYGSRGEAVAGATKALLLAAGEKSTYVKLGETRV